MTPFHPFVNVVSIWLSDLQVCGKSILLMYWEKHKAELTLFEVAVPQAPETDVIWLVGWQLHAAAFRARPNCSVQLTKLCHELLPMATKS